MKRYTNDLSYIQWNTPQWRLPSFYKKLSCLFFFFFSVSLLSSLMKRSLYLLEYSAAFFQPSLVQCQSHHCSTTYLLQHHRKLWILRVQSAINMLFKLHCTVSSKLNVVIIKDKPATTNLAKYSLLLSQRTVRSSPQLSLLMLQCKMRCVGTTPTQSSSTKSTKA